MNTPTFEARLAEAQAEVLRQRAIARSMRDERDHYKSLLDKRLALLEEQFHTHVMAHAHWTEADRATFNAINQSQPDSRKAS